MAWSGGPAFRAAVFASVPFPFAFRLDAGTVDEQAQRAGASTKGQAHVQCLLAAAQGAEIRHRPVQPDQPQQALDETRGLPERHAEKHLQSQASLDRGIAELLLPPTFSRWRWRPVPLRIKPDRKRSALLQCCVVRRLVPGLVLRKGPTAHATQLSCWIHAVNPRRNLCNKATPKDQTLSQHRISVPTGQGRGHEAPLYCEESVHESLNNRQ
ncbi:hypothetical protein SAMN04515673_101592 [Poseidonocella sedimentorum]|uniref:Uncharacterized protein n=1 Tax=Poseidonocella sedimentorum TaxID=871652 RepID=A0A1I6CZ23_9RHOB|nr:hypothetical protein SAMN04515673_101592 [Poseidonocella sedimentorum]